MRGALGFPWPVNSAIVGALGVGWGILEVRHLRAALEWAGSQPGTRRAWRVALELLANGARSLASEALVVQGSPEAIRGRFVLEGRTYLEAARRQGATIVLGFHLGPGLVSLSLRALGYRMTVTGLGRNPVAVPLRQAAWAAFLEPGENPFLFWADPEARLTSLPELRRRLLDGQTIYMTADGPGVEAFRIPLPGRDMLIRSGWFVLRRHTRAVTLPVLSHRQGSRIIVTVHPPLPAPDPDPQADRAACRAALASVVEDYVRRFPAQCFSLAIFARDVHTDPAVELAGHAG